MNNKALSTSRRLTAAAMVALAILLIATLSGNTGIVVAQTGAPAPRLGPTLIATPISGPSAVVTTGRLNVRKGPGPGFAIVGVVSQGDTLLLLGRTTNNGWVMVKPLSGGVDGWVTTFYIDTDVPISSLPVMGTADPWAIVTAPLLNVRSGPGTAYTVVTTVPKGRLITLIGRTANNAFVDVVADGIEGWVSTFFIKAGAPISSLPITWLQPIAAPGVAVTATLQPNQTLVPVPSATPLVAVTVTPGAGTSIPTGPSAVITTGKLNVRTGPGPGYGVVGTVDQGQTVSLLGRTGNLAWVNIKIPGTATTGWISERYIEADVPISSLPVLMQAPPWAVVTAPVLNVRSGPGSEFTVLTTVPQGRMITLIGRTADNAWVKVVANGTEGWVTTLHIQASGPISPLPIAN